MGLVRARLATCCFDARAWTASSCCCCFGGMPPSALRAPRACAAPSSPSPTDHHLLAIAFVFGSIHGCRPRPPCAVATDGWTWTNARVIPVPAVTPSSRRLGWHSTAHTTRSLLRVRTPFSPGKLNCRRLCWIRSAHRPRGGNGIDHEIGLWVSVLSPLWKRSSLRPNTGASSSFPL